MTTLSTETQTPNRIGLDALVALTLGRTLIVGDPKCPESAIKFKPVGIAAGEIEVTDGTTCLKTDIVAAACRIETLAAALQTWGVETPIRLDEGDQTDLDAMFDAAIARHELETWA